MSALSYISDVFDLFTAMHRLVNESKEALEFLFVVISREMTLSNLRSDQEELRVYLSRTRGYKLCSSKVSE